jgi:hypothetical protein
VRLNPDVLWHFTEYFTGNHYCLATQDCWLHPLNAMCLVNVELELIGGFEFLNRGHFHTKHWR